MTPGEAAFMKPSTAPAASSAAAMLARSFLSGASSLMLISLTHGARLTCGASPMAATRCT